MRFLKAFLEEATRHITTRKEPPKPPKPSCVSFVSPISVEYGAGEANLPDTVTLVLRTFPGAKIVAMDKPLSCRPCTKDSVPSWRRGGKIVQVIEPSGAPAWLCHYCGRRAAA